MLLSCAGVVVYLSANNDFSAQQLGGKRKEIQQKRIFNSFVLLTYFFTPPPAKGPFSFLPNI